MEIILHDQVAKFVQRVAQEHGLTDEEMVRYIVGDYVSKTYPMPIPTSPSNNFNPFSGLSPEIQLLNIGKTDVGKVFEMMVRQMSVNGILKCPKCTQPLTMEAIKQGKCQNCEMEI